MEVLRHNVVSPADVAEDQSVPSDVLKKLLPHQLQDDGDDDCDCDGKECDVSGGFVARPRVTRSSPVHVSLVYSLAQRQASLKAVLHTGFTPSDIHWWW